jgi:hypothetical protein
VWLPLESSFRLELLLFFFVPLSHLLSFFFLWEKSFSQDHSSFFGSGETKKKLTFELSQLKA